MKITVHSIYNGAYAVYDNETEEGLPDVDAHAYPFKDEGQDDYKIAILRDIAESLFGVGGKYDEKRMDIRFVHGSDYTCKDKKKCEVCNALLP